MCESYGATLISINNQTMDFCAASSIDINKSFDQMILYSGRYSRGFSSWVWCSGDECDQPFGYENWNDSTDQVGKCMGGYFEDYDSAGGLDGVTKACFSYSAFKSVVPLLCKSSCCF